jgi:membrane dipeptidase
LNDTELLELSRGIHARVISIDTHLDIEVTFFNKARDGYDRCATVAGMRKGGLDGAFFAAFLPQGPLTKTGYKKAYALVEDKIRTIHRAAEKEIPDKVEIAYHPDDVERIRRSGKIVVIIGIENGYCVGEDLGNLKKLYDLGARYITLSHIGHNQICDSNLDRHSPRKPGSGGVTPFGEKVIEEMNRLGFIVDVTHTSNKTVLDAARLSKAPVMASHSCHHKFFGPKFYNITRMWEDGQLLAVKENGGLFNALGLRMGNFKHRASKEEFADREVAVIALRCELGFAEEEIPFLMKFKDSPKKAQDTYLKRLKEIDSKYHWGSVEDFIDQLDYAVKLIGVDHVGISSDFGSFDSGIQGWRDASETFNLTLEMVKRGYSEADIAKIWSGNMLRVWRAAERIKQTLD